MANGAGAIASNAGDDFHLLWAAKKILSLLKQDTDLSAVTLEGPVNADNNEQVIDKDKLLSIDLAEYYNGNTFLTASKVIFSQLKYSSYQANKPLNISDLCKATNQKGANSIIRRLADTYVGFLSNYDSTNEKLELKLVSNRCISTSLMQSLRDVADIQKCKHYSRTMDLLRNLPKSARSEIENLYTSSRLKSSQFIGFLDILDFSECGASNRSIQKTEIMQQFERWGYTNSRSKYNDLLMYIRASMLPDGCLGYPITRDTVFSIIGLNRLSVFPAIAKLSKPQFNYIEREFTGDFINNVLLPTRKPICIHATAGVGKTTFVCNLLHHLPEGSLSVLYDCYGGGAYLQPDERRHLPQVAIPQICNTISAECGTDLLLDGSLLEYQLFKEFKSRLNDAANYVSKLNPSAIVLIVIDAVDNSAIAAQDRHEVCFANELVKMSFPDQVRIILTMRTERKDYLDLTEKINEYPISPFSLNESTQHFRQRFPMATNDECLEFHELTSNNPRMQSYLLAKQCAMPADTLSYVKPNGKSLNGLFEDFIEEARIGYINNNVENILRILIDLPRPIPLDVALSLCACSKELVQSLSIICLQGIYLDKDNINFRDEDFETFLREKYSHDKNSVRTIAEYMYENRDLNGYCARNVCSFLDKIDEFEKLLQLSLHETVNTEIVDIAEQNRIMLMRISNILKRQEISDDQNKLDACKLIYKSIDYNANDEALYNFIFKYPNEASICCEETTLLSVFDTDKHSFESFSKAALVFSRVSQFISRSKDYIKDYCEAVNFYYSQSQKQRTFRDGPDLKTEVFCAEAILRVYGIDKTKLHIRSWRPKSFRASLIFCLFEQLSSIQDVSLCSILLSHRWNFTEIFALTTACINRNLDPPENFIRHIISVMKRLRSIPENYIPEKQLVIFLEYIASRSGMEDDLNSLMSKIEVFHQYSVLHTIYDQNQTEIDLSLKYYCLKKAILKQSPDAEDFWTDRELNQDVKWTQKELDERKAGVIKTIKPLMLIYSFRTRVLLGITNSEFIIECSECMNSFERVLWNFRDYDREGIVKLGLSTLADAVIRCKGLTEEKVYYELTKINNLTKKSILTDLELASVCSLDLRSSQFALEILEKISKSYNDDPASAAQTSETLARCAIIGQNINYYIRQKYFAMAIKETEGIDYESYRKLKLFTLLSQNALKSGGLNCPELSFEIVRLSEDRCRKIGDTKNFPYDDALTSAILLCPENIWGHLCRMDDRNNFDGFGIDDTLFSTLQTMFTYDYLSCTLFASLAGALLPDDPNSYIASIETILDRIPEASPEIQNRLIDVFADDCILNLPINYKERLSSILLKYIDSHPLIMNEKAAQICKLHNFTKELPQREKRYDFSDEEQVAEIREQALSFEFFKITTDEQLKNALLNQENLPKKIEYLNDWLDYYASYNRPKALTTALLAALQCSSNFIAEKLISLVATRAEKWEVWPEVSTWRKDVIVLKMLFRDYGRDLINPHTKLLDLILSTFNMQNSELLSIITEYVSNHLPLYDDYAISVLCKLSQLLSPEENLSFLKWCIQNEHSSLHPMSGDGDLPLAGNVNGTMDECIAKFIWRLLGHPQKSLRWKASHVIIRLANFEFVNIIDHLISLYNDSIDKFYIDKNNYFFIESAKLWLLFVCHKLCLRQPEIVRKHFSFFKNIACCMTNTHALQRRVARSISLQLAMQYNATEIPVIEQCDSLKDLLSSSSKNVDRYSHSKLKCNFSFDEMDTLPYWYSDLADIFSITEGDVAKTCDYYIARMGISNELSRTWSNSFLKQRDYVKVYNDHGSIPLVESMQKYAEWHSMFYAADHYRVNMPTAKDTYKNFHEWLDSYFPGDGVNWSHEFRCQVPYIQFLWNFERNARPDVDNAYYIPEDLVEDLIGNEVITLCMDYSANFKQCSQRVHIESAFINSDKVDDFITELVKPNMYFSNFYIDQDLKYSARNKKPLDVVLLPTMINSISLSDDRLDKHDLLAKELPDCFYSFNPILLKELGFTGNPRELLLPGNTYPFDISYWSEPSNEWEYEKSNTYGHMASVPKELLLEILKKKEKSIVFETKITFEDQHYEFHGTPWNKAKQKYVSILCSDGDIIHKALEVDPNSYY